MNDQEIVNEFVQKAESGEFLGRTNGALAEKYMESQARVTALRQQEAKLTQQMQQMQQQLMSTQIQIREELGKSSGVLESVVALSDLKPVSDFAEKSKGAPKKTRRKR